MAHLEVSRNSGPLLQVLRIRIIVCIWVCFGGPYLWKLHVSGMLGPPKELGFYWEPAV